ncbi:MAG: GNAT family N-acetyltransferase [Saprospiraceae bacterium]|nr:GNAT family N-acetyltransferase [Saprospiraceae bacterium]
MQEIGRLRELTFRVVGEGTGKTRDLDEYDLYYRQLILWDRESKQIAGGYRMGIGDEIFERYGAAGFYISSLFKIKEGFHPYMKKSVELGRSFIVPDHQRKRLPLFLLWKGILYFLLKNPRFSYLYGPVSISKYYSNLSRGVIVAYIKKYFYNNELAHFLKPRKPFKVKVDKGGHRDAGREPRRPGSVARQPHRGHRARALPATGAGAAVPQAQRPFHQLQRGP